MKPGAWRDSPDPGERDVLIFRGRAVPEMEPPHGDREWLSTAERGRAEGFRFDVDRRRYLARTVLRRRILGVLLGLDPGAVRFAEGAHGKPCLDPTLGSEIQFSASHSGDEILLAVGRREVGVDLQDCRPLEELAAMAERILHVAERSPWEALSPADRPAAFWRLWCRKEAALKAIGTGFTREPRTLHVGLDPATPGVPGVPPDPGLAAFGRLADLDAPPGFAAAVCAAGEGWRVVEAKV